MAVGRFYEGTLVERGTGYGLTAVTVPLDTALAGGGKEVLSSAAACANALDADFLRPVEGWHEASAVVAAVLDGASPERLEAYFEFMARRVNKTLPEVELRARPVWQATDALMYSDLVPFEASPLSGESLATLVGSGGLASAAGVVVLTTGVVPALALLGVGAFGIVLTHAAEGVGEGLRQRLRRWAAGQGDRPGGQG